MVSDSVTSPVEWEQLAETLRSDPDSLRWREREALLAENAAAFTDDLLQNTLAVWSQVYEQPLTTDDAVEILMNVKRFSEALLQTGKEET